MFRSQIVIVLLASLAIFSQAQVARRTVSGTVYSQYGSSYIYVSIYCADSNVIYTTFSSSSYSYATSLTYSYTDCAARLGNNVNDPISVLVWADSTSYTQNTTVMESEFLAQVSGSSGVDFYPNTAVKIAALPISVSSSGSSYYTTYNFTLIVVGNSCGNGYRESSLGEECDGYGYGCDYDTCTCRSASGYYPDTSDLSNTDCVYGYNPVSSDVSYLAVFLGVFVPIFVIVIVLSVVLRVLFIRGVIACCGVRRPRTTVQTVTVTQPATTTTTTTTTAVVQGQQPGVTQVPYYPQPQQPQQQYAPQQYPVQQPMFVPQQGHVVPPPQQQHVMQYPPQQQQQPNVDGQVLPPQQYSQPMMQQQPYAPQPYPDQPTPYGYPGGNAPVQGGYVVYSPPPQGGAFQPQEPPK